MCGAVRVALCLCLIVVPGCRPPAVPGLVVFGGALLALSRRPLLRPYRSSRTVPCGGCAVAKGKVVAAVASGDTLRGHLRLLSARC